MKRKSSEWSKEYSSVGAYDLRKDFGDERLIHVGAICLVWNLLEDSIDVVLVICLELLPPIWDHVTSRIHGIDGKIAIIKSALKNLRWASGKQYEMIAGSLGAAELYKKYRDAVIHARVHDPSSPYAPSFKNKGDTIEVLVSLDALQNLLQRIRIVQEELGHITHVMHGMALLRNRLLTQDLPEDERQQIAAKVRDSLFRVQSLQKTRNKFPPLPEFPEELSTHSKTEEQPKPQG